MSPALWRVRAAAGMLIHSVAMAGTEETSCARTAIEIDAAPSCNCSACAVFGSSWLKDKCCQPKLRGVWATLLAFERDDLWVPRLQEFSACTGARVSLAYVPNGEDGMEAALREDVGIDYVQDGGRMEKSGAGIYDAYIVQPPWLPAIQSGLENLSPRIAKTPALNWLDINGMSRQIVSFNNTVRALPLDVDYIALGWRKDVFDAHGKHPPETLEELVELAEFFNGKDHNGDGEPDWGFCITPQPNYFMAFVAPILQMTHRECRLEHGRKTCDGDFTGHNLFFNASTFEPFLDNPGFRYAVELHRRFLLASNCQDQLKPIGTNPYALGGKCCRKVAMQTGKCAGVISMPGTMTKLLKPWSAGGEFAPQPRRDQTGSIVWQVSTEDGSYWGRRLRFPGSTKVWDRDANLLRDCDPVLCPKALPHSRTGRLVNYAPFFAEGGESYAIRAAGSEIKKDLIWELFSWLGTLPVTALPLSGFYRESQIRSETQNNQLIENGWPRQMVDDLFRLLNFYFLDLEEGDGNGSLGNAAMDLLVLGFSEYMSELKRFMLQDFLLNPDVYYNHSNPKVFPEELYRLSAQRLTVAYDEHTKKYGRLNQITRWRASLNMPFMTHPEICDKIRHKLLEEDCRQFMPSDTRDFVTPALLCMGSVLFSGALLFTYIKIKSVCDEIRTKRILEEKREKEYKEIIVTAEEELDLLGHPMVLIQAQRFLELGKLVSYENLRDRGALVYLDTLEKALDFKQNNFIVFMSHQWLGWGDPDPDMVHYAAMSGAVRDLATRVRHIRSLSDVNDVDTPPVAVNLENMYIWCDYISIAQEHRPTQIMAVSSLPVYSSVADVFVIVAPPAKHADSGLPCDVDTYNSRGWCRAEMLSKVCGTGMSQMFLASSKEGTVEPLTDFWLDRLDFKVFYGAFSCCHLGHKSSSVCDKESLVKPVLGLYSLILRQRHSDSILPVLRHIEQAKEMFFPGNHTFKRYDGSQEVRELFGPLVQYMEKHVLTTDSYYGRRLSYFSSSRRPHSVHSEDWGGDSSDSPLSNDDEEVDVMNNYCRHTTEPASECSGSA
mmetsp:Transcript_82811/g.208543  ORF Transcript_82811/g.208543 Transcript_82811/m.208543 type:complete len:1058 (-) Transcript_82811:163-3336(-)